jgi:hypothetical protein
MDNASKTILAVIAIALCAIAFKLYQIPTVGDLIALREVKDQKQRGEMQLKIRKRTPLVNAYVSGGSVSVD